MNSREPGKMEAHRAPASHSQSWRLQRRDEILAAAFEEFAAKGYADARLDDVARRAGVAKGTLYLYFKSKERLFCAVLRSFVHHVFKQIESFVRTFPGSAEELTRKVVSRQYAEIVKNPQTRSIIRLLIAESHRFPQLSDICLREVITPSLNAMRLLVEKGVASGEFRKTKISEFPQVLVGPALLAVVWMLIIGERQQLDLDGYMEAHLDLLLHGLQISPAGADLNSDDVLNDRGRP